MVPDDPQNLSTSATWPPPSVQSVLDWSSSFTEVSPLPESSAVPSWDFFLSINCEESDDHFRIWKPVSWILAFDFKKSWKASSTELLPENKSSTYVEFKNSFTKSWSTSLYFFTWWRKVAFNKNGLGLSPNTSRQSRLMTISGVSLWIFEIHKKRKKSRCLSSTATIRKAFSKSPTSATCLERKRNIISIIFGNNEGPLW